MDPLQALLTEAALFDGAPADAALWQRLDWLDRLELHAPEALVPGSVAAAGPSPEVLASLRALGEAMMARNAGLYAALRAEIAGGGRQRLTALLSTYAPANAAPDDAEGFDALDEFFMGLLDLPIPGAPQARLGEGMVAYQPTPARHVLDLLRQTALGEDDVLVDLGAGLGQVPLLAALCSPARAWGIEIEPSFVAAARAAAASLRLGHARFTCADLRAADLADGTVFYLYTPLRGGLLQDLLARLEVEATRRPLRVCGFGPCVPVLAMQPWLRPRGPAVANRVAVFAAGSSGA